MKKHNPVRYNRFVHPLLPYGMIAPSILIFSIFMIYPIFYMIYLSFYKWDMISDRIFTGVKNYVSLFTNPDFLQVLANSFQYMALTVAFTLVLALLLAVYLKRNTKTNTMLQSILFAPYIISFVSVSFIWMWMMDSSYGLFNLVLKMLNLGQVKWLEDPHTAMASLVLVAIWKGVGYNTIILIAGLMGIPPFIYEAAELDRAKPATVFFRITLPLLSPTLFFLTLVNMIASLKVFETISIMTKGGPMNSTNTLVYYIYQYGFGYYKIGYASAAGVVLMAIIGILTLLYFKLLSTRVHYK